MHIIKEKPPSARLRGFSTCQKSMKGNLQVSKYIIFILIDNVYSFLHVNSYKQSLIETKCHRMGVGAEHTLEEAVATPTESGVLSCPKFINSALSAVLKRGFWARCAYPKGRQHGFFHVFNTPAHLKTLNSQMVVINLKKEI